MRHIFHSLHLYTRRGNRLCKKYRLWGKNSIKINKRMYKYLLFSILCIALMNACDKNGDIISEVDLIVSAEMLIAVDPVSAEETAYIQVKEVGANWDYWLNLYGINGFEYEEGYEYLLRVRKKVTEDPLPDLPNVEYTLIRIISKTKK